MFGLLVRNVMLIGCCWTMTPADCCAQASKVGTTGQESRYNDSIYLISPHDRFDTVAGRLDDLIVNEYGWPAIRQKIIERARQKGANVALVRFHGNYDRSLVHAVRAVLFYADSTRVTPLLSDGSCSITIFRDKGYSVSPVTYAVTINDVLFRYFGDQTYVRARLIGCPDSVVVKINRKRHVMQLHGHSGYFRLIKKDGVGGSAVATPGGGVDIMIPISGTAPNYVLEEIEDEEFGRLYSGSLTERPAVNR